MVTVGFAVTRVIVDSRPLFDEWGMVGRWTGRVSREIKQAVILEAPVNKRAVKSDWDSMYPIGSLKRSITARSMRIAPHGRDITVGSSVPYALFVHDGTMSPILPKRGKYLRLPVTAIPLQTVTRRHTAGGKRYITRTTEYGNKGFSLRKSVRGQSANPFILRGYNFTAARHGALPHLATPHY